MTFECYDKAGFTSELLPITPPNANIDPDSPQLASLEKSRGKLPGNFRAGYWTGMAKWPQHQATQADIERWASWGSGIGIQGRVFPALDIDVDDEPLAVAIEKLAVSCFGNAPARFGREPRRLLVYHGPGLSKKRLAFRATPAACEPAEPDSRLLPVVHAVEFLATGQQYVLEGVHPKTLKPYHWRDGLSLAAVGRADLQSVTSEQVDAFFDSLQRLLVLHGCEVVSAAKPGRLGSGGVWQDGLLAPSPDAVGRALSALRNEFDYDDWLTIGIAIKAACGPDNASAAFDMFDSWSMQWEQNDPEVILAKWESMRPPFRVGWDFLSRFATENGDGSFFGAHEDFDAVALSPEAHATALEAQPLTAMFTRYVWVERLQRICDLETGDLLNREMFNIRNWHIGDPASARDCAYAQFTRSGERHLAVKTVTYRPGGTKFVREHLPGLEGLCVNRWNDPSPNLPVSATDDEVAPWLDHVAFVIPDDRERNIVLNWLAWIIQHPGEKPNWALVIGSTVEGMGKDMMLEPVRHALGHGNVREIGPDDLVSGYTDFLAGTRLLLVEEMQMTERKAMQNRLKPLIAAPPYTLRVNIKFEPQFEIPNLVASIFFTNIDNALAMSGQDRRYFVTWNNGQPRPGDYYEGLSDWYAAGGAVKAARWLLDRDVSQFKAKGRAPETAAKDQMRKAGLPEADGLIAEAMEHRDPPFHRRFIRLTDVLWFINSQTDGLCRVTAQQLARKLKAAGALPLDRVCLGKSPKGVQEPPSYNAKQMQLFVMPGDTAALELRNDTCALREAFWSDWTAGLDAEDREGVHDIFS